MVLFDRFSEGGRVDTAPILAEPLIFNGIGTTFLPRLRPLVLLGALAVFSGPLAAAHAQEAAAPAKSRRQPIYFSVFTGVNHTSNSDLHIIQPATNSDATFHDVAWRARPFTGSVYYGYRVGTFFRNTPRVGIELEFNHYKAYAKVEQRKRVSGTWQGAPVDTTAPIEDRVGEFRITNGVNAITIAATYRVPVQASPGFPDGRIQPYVAGGPTYYLYYPVNEVNGLGNTDSRGYQKGNGELGFQLRGGLRYGLTSRISLFTEAKYTYAHPEVRVRGGEGSGETTLRTTHLLGGFSYNF